MRGKDGRCLDVGQGDGHVGQMFSFRILGFPIHVHWSFWLIAALIGGGLQALEIGKPDAWGLVMLNVVLIFASIIAHELGHALAARKYGRESEIFLHSIGGLARFHGSQLTRKEDIIITACGPATNIAIAAVIYLAFPLLPANTSEFILMGVNFLFVINVFWAIFNLLPLLPLDGGHLAHAIVGSNQRTTLKGLALVLGGLAAVFFWSVTLILMSFLTCVLIYLNMSGKIRPREFPGVN